MELRHLLGYGLVLFGTVMLTLSPYSFDVTQLKTPMTRKRALPHRERARSIVIFIGKFLSYLGWSALFISLGLIVGIIGYHWAAGLSWLDALVEASMILSGMGPISPLSTTSAKVFASLSLMLLSPNYLLQRNFTISPLFY